MKEAYFEYMRNGSDEERMMKEKFLYMRYRQKRLRSYVGLTLTISGFIIYIFFRLYLNYESVIPKVAGLLISIAGTAFFLLNYLSDYSSSMDGDRSISYKLQLELEELRLDLQKIKKNSGAVDNYKDINDSINSIIDNTFTEEFIQNKIEKTFGDNAVKNERYNKLFREFDKTSARINGELLRLRKSANINLVIGSSFTIVIIFVLSYEVFFSEINFEKMVNLLSHYIPRISIIVFIEIFAFFFLKLYKSNLQEIKYFNNEKTNVDFKLITLKTALYQEDLEMIKMCLSELIKTERNFILKKEESTVEIEKIKLDSSNNKFLIDLITKIIPQK